MLLVGYKYIIFVGAILYGKQLDSLCVMTYGQLWHEYVHDAQCMVNTYVVVHPTVTHGLKVGAMLISLNPLMS